MNKYRTVLQPLVSPMSTPNNPLPSQLEPPGKGWNVQQVMQVMAQDPKGGIVPFLWVLWVKFDDADEPDESEPSFVAGGA